MTSTSWGKAPAWPWYRGCPGAADEGLLDAGDVGERALEDRLRPVGEQEQIRERTDQRTVAGAQQPGTTDPAIGEDAGPQKAFDLCVQVPGVASCFAGEVGDAGLTIGVQQHRRQQTGLRSLRSTGASTDALRVIRTRYQVCTT